MILLISPERGRRAGRHRAHLPADIRVPQGAQRRGHGRAPGGQAETAVARHRRGRLRHDGPGQGRVGPLGRRGRLVKSRRGGMGGNRSGWVCGFGRRSGSATFCRCARGDRRFDVFLKWCQINYFSRVKSLLRSHSKKISSTKYDYLLYTIFLNNSL